MRKGSHPSLEARRRMSEAKKGRHPSEETKRKISLPMRRRKHMADAK